MPLPPSGPQPSSESPSTRSEETPPDPREQEIPPGEATQKRLLEQVLRQTALASMSEEAMDAQHLESLRGVAKRLQGQPFTLQPVAVELVHATLQPQFEMLSSSPRDWKVISARIAETLFDDPLARKRLESLWRQLSEPQ